MSVGDRSLTVAVTAVGSDIAQTVIDGLRACPFPVRIGDGPTLTYAPAPQLGEHTDEVPGEWLGLSGGTIRELRDEGVV